jgi:hypothetical protein
MTAGARTRGGRRGGEEMDLLGKDFEGRRGQALMMK